MMEKIIVPKLGTTVKKAKILKWLFSEGQFVKKGDEICELETEKVNYQVEASASGVLVQISVPEGQVANVGQTIGLIAKEGETAHLKSASASETEEPKKIDAAVASAGSEKTAVKMSGKKERIKITPIAKKLATENEIDITLLSGSGPGGRILKLDVLAHLDKMAKTEIEKMPTEDSDAVFGTTIPLTNIREIIGERLGRSSRDVPHVYFSCEVDCTGLIKFRSTFLEIIERKTGKRLSYNDLIVKAVAMNIENFPLFNATLEGKNIKINKDIDIGFAMALEEGLIVPVVRNANNKTISQILVERTELVNKARNKKLAVDDITGGTFTVSNLGRFNIDFFTSIINPPETGILSVAKMKERPVVIDGQIEIRPTIKIGLSADHRVVDGADAARFLQDLQLLLENPFTMCNV